MQPWVEEYAAKHGLLGHGAAPRVDSIFFTNFFVSKVSWWSEPPVQAFLGAIAASANIYTHRWGDAPIQTAAVRLFAPAASVGRLAVDYLHASTMNRIHASGGETDGTVDAEMGHHPLVRAFLRRAGREAAAAAAAASASAAAAAAADTLGDGDLYQLEIARQLSEGSRDDGGSATNSTNGTLPSTSFLEIAFTVNQPPSTFDDGLRGALAALFAAKFGIGDAAVRVLIASAPDSAPDDLLITH